MATVGGELYFYISGLISRVSTLNDDEYVSELVKVAKQKLHNIELERWSMYEIEENLLARFKSQGLSLDYDLEKLAEFVLFAINDEEKISYEYEMMYKLAGALERAKIPIAQFQIYLSVLTKRKVVDSFEGLYGREEYDKCLDKIIAEVPIDDFSFGNLSNMLRIVSEYTGKPYDPIFLGNYGVIEVFYTLSDIMSRPNYVDSFGAEDLRKLDNVANLMISVISPESYKTLEENIRELVAKTDSSDAVFVVKCVLEYLDGYWNSLEEGEIDGEEEPEIPNNVVKFKK